MKPFALFLMIIAACQGYNPPSDTAGPLTVRIQPPALGSYGAGGYAELSRPDTPVNLPVTLENSGDAPLKGTLRLGLADEWKAEPAGPLPFSLAPKGRARFEFTLSFGKGTLTAHYPVHAYAEFDHAGEHLTAHPVLILQTRIPDLPRPKLPFKWEPVPVPASGTLGLHRLPVRRESAAVAVEGADAGSTGREVYEASSIIQYDVRVQGRQAISMMLGKRQPSLRETVTMAAVEYPLALPVAKPLRLDFAVAGAGQFRVKVGDKAVFEGKAAPSGWRPAGVDLGAWSGKQVVLRLEAEGTQGEAAWAEPTITAGAPPKAPAFPPVSDQGALRLGVAGSCQVLVWPGSRGVLDAPIGFVCGQRRLVFRGFRARVTGDALEEWTAASELVEARKEDSAGRHRVRHRFRNWAGTFDLLSELWVEKEGLNARFWLENAPAPKPWFNVYLESIAAGPWTEKVARVYGGPGNVIQDPQAFRLNYDGHSMATSFAGFDFANGMALVEGLDVVPDRLEVDPETRFASLVAPHAQTMTMIPAANVWNGVKNWRDRQGLRAPAGVPKLAGRFVFDLWSGRYGESARKLEEAAKYGLTDAVVVWHNWQRWGYDYRLPDLYPPNPQYGTFEEFQRLVEVCSRHGILFAPHDNYIDYYPDHEGFSYRNIAFQPNGQPRRAWFNYGREAQAYRARGDRVREFVERNLRLIKSGFSPTAYFIDVWSSISPYDFWTMDGKFVERGVTRKVWGEAFAWIRDYLGDNAPQISEAGHDQLVGWLDGAQAQQLRIDPEAKSFTWRIRCADSERIPWIDAAYHDKFILHGAGYEGRYVGGLSMKEHGAYSDDYISTEVLSGRPAMVPQPFNRDVVRKYWLLHGAMRALALDRIASVEFDGGNIHRQHVRWERGGEVWVNRGAEAWSVAGHTLPQYGFYLKAGDVEAAIETQGGRRVEWSRSPQARYENGRRTSGQTVLDLPQE